ncbi:MAG: DUF1295 domain-containing protein [Gammaproteobacteria bacterium]
MLDVIWPALIFCCIMMLCLWLVQLKTHNAGTVDVAWSFATGLVGIWFAIAVIEGTWLRNIIVGSMIGLWGVRLGIHLFRRVMLESEDGRYRYMRESCGKYAQPVMFIFFQIQAGWAILFALPVLVAVSNPSATLGITDYLGIAVWIISMSGEFIADRELSLFRQDPANKGKVCKRGLWRYSRHPNYFFEWLHWFAYILIGYGSSVWWLSWAIMILMLVFLLKVTGVPHTESQSLRSRGDAYRQYQKETSIFIPLPPKHV